MSGGEFGRVEWCDEVWDVGGPVLGDSGTGLLLGVCFAAAHDDSGRICCVADNTLLLCPTFCVEVRQVRFRSRGVYLGERAVNASGMGMV